nr:DUF899 family protein [Sedimenticola hydrogenitrophicus]
MTEARYPNESAECRLPRKVLLVEEKALVERVEAVADQRRKLPLGGRHRLEAECVLGLLFLEA